MGDQRSALRTKMEFLRPYFWAILLLVILPVSLVIILIFIIINVCISKRAAQYQTQTKADDYRDPQFKAQLNQVYHKNFENEKPPLPPRDQFQSMDSVDQSYEEVELLPDPVAGAVQTPAEPQQPLTPQHTLPEGQCQDTVSSSEDYDDVEMPADCDSEDYDDVG